MIQWINEWMDEESSKTRSSKYHEIQDNHSLEALRSTLPLMSWKMWLIIIIATFGVLIHILNNSLISLMCFAH